MDKLLRDRRNNLNDFKKYLGKNKITKQKEIPDGLYVKCPSCLKTIENNDLKVCPNCDHHLYLNSYSRLNMIYDDSKYKEYYKNMKTINPLDFPGYESKLEKAHKQTGLNDGVIVTSGLIGGIKAVVCVMDNKFMMASLGSVAGEKLTRAIEMATKKKRPLIIFSSSGGARMQEGIISLMQMEKTCMAIKRHLNANLLYISYLTHPTTGGVTASFAMLGDINIAEPKALIGFAGPRVIESTIKQKLPDDFQSSQYALEHGFVDMIVERKNMRQTLITLLKMHSKEAVCL